MELKVGSLFSTLGVSNVPKAFFSHSIGISIGNALTFIALVCFTLTPSPHLPPPHLCFWCCYKSSRNTPYYFSFYKQTSSHFSFYLIRITDLKAFRLVLSKL